MDLVTVCDCTRLVHDLYTRLATRSPHPSARLDGVLQDPLYTPLCTFSTGAVCAACKSLYTRVLGSRELGCLMTCIPYHGRCEMCDTDGTCTYGKSIWFGCFARVGRVVDVGHHCSWPTGVLCTSLHKPDEESSTRTVLGFGLEHTGRLVEPAFNSPDPSPNDWGKIYLRLVSPLCVNDYNWYMGCVWEKNGDVGRQTESFVNEMVMTAR